MCSACHVSQATPLDFSIYMVLKYAFVYLGQVKIAYYVHALGLPINLGIVFFT